MEPTMTQETIKSEFISSSKQAEQLCDNVQTSVHKDYCNQTSFPGSHTYSNQPDADSLEHKYVHCGETNEQKFCSKQNEVNAPASTKACLSDETSGAHASGNERTQYGKIFKFQRSFAVDSDVRRQVLGMYPKIKKYPCKSCELRFFVKSELLKHMRTHSNGVHQCPVCERTFTHKAVLGSHLRVHKTDFECKICPEKFHLRSDLERHQRVHKTDFECKFCLEKFPDRYVLKRHILLHKLYQCDFCKKEFGVKHNLMLHLRIHTGEKPYQCGICMKRFSNQICLKSHERVHTDEKPYQCQMCMKKFRTRSALCLHIRGHTEERQSFKCDICMQQFYKMHTLNAHKQLHAVPPRRSPRLSK